MDGKMVRMGRIMEKGRAVIVPMDHGTSLGPVEGIEEMDVAARKVASGGASAVLLHKGIISSLNQPPGIGLIMHASASTRLAPDKDQKVIVSIADDALRLGADAVSVHVNVGGSEHEPSMLEDLGMMASRCGELGMPLLAMMYARGDNVKDSLDPENVSLAARLGAELGADIVKCNYTGDPDSFKQVVRGCPVPVVIAGGPKCETDMDVLEMVRGAMDAGASGISIGRNIFANKDPERITRALRAIIVDNKAADEAGELLGDS
jgi:predicted phospho-2-dehydro-3-deoxyheptonate aldolase